MFIKPEVTLVTDRLIRLRLRTLFPVILFLCGGLFAEDIRIWRNQQDERFEGRYVRILLGKVMLETGDGQKIYIPLKELSKWDHKYLSSIFIPRVNIQFSDSSRSKFRSKNALADDMIRIVTGTATVESKDQLESDTLNMEVYLIGAEVATDDFKMLEKGTMPLIFTEENEYTCRLVLEIQSRRYMEYNYQLRGCVYLGYVIVIRDHRDQVVDFRSDINWIKEGQLDKLRQFEKSEFFNSELQARPVPRPKNTGMDRVGVQ
jgi:hypothetical protein